MADTLKVTQLTDLHLGETPDYCLRGVVTMVSLQAVLQQVDQRGRGDDLFLLTGDLASDCQPAAYQMLDALLTKQDRCAIWLPGNHDDSAAMQQNLVHYPPISVYEDRYWGILTLDSSKFGEPGGYISEYELQQVEKGLQQLADKYVLAAMHHSPISIRSPWLDEHRIVNQQQLHQLLSAHGNVKAVVFGHVHQQYEDDWEGIPAYSAPSTCSQFQQGTKHCVISDQPPGYRMFDLYPDGRIETAVEFIEDYNPQRQADLMPV